MDRRRHYLVGVLAAALLAVFAVAGCGGDGNSSDTDSSASGGQADLKEAEARLAKWEKGQFDSPPTSGPPAAPNKNVWSLTYGLAATPGADFTEGFDKAAKVLGWKTTSCDGKFDTQQWQKCIRQAVAAGADGMGFYTVDCASMEAALREAKDAGMVLVSSESLDCDQQQEGAEPLFDHQLQFAQGGPEDWLGDLNRPAADAITVDSGGDAKIILLNEIGQRAVEIMTEGFKEEISELCPSCEIVEQVDYKGDEFGGPLTAKVGQALLQQPDADYIVSPYDDATIAGVVQAVRESDRPEPPKIYSGVGIEPALELVRKGEITGEYVQDLRWEGWGVIDAMNRIFNGEEPQPSGQGIGYITPETVSKSGRYKPPFDYEAIYTKTLSGKGQ